MNYTNFVLFMTVCMAADVHTNGILSNNSSCENGWEQHDDRCFKLVRRYLTWKEASDNCKNMGGNLASVHSSEQNEILEDILNRNNIHAAWIGLYDYKLNATSEWDDGTIVDYTNWENEGAVLYGKIFCTITLKGEWLSFYCDRRGFSICQKQISRADLTNKQKSNSSDSAADLTNKQKNDSFVHHRSALSEESLHACGHGWHKNGNYCYHLERHARKWDSASCHCLRKGGYLTSIHSKKEQDFLNDFFLKGINEKVWIGLHDISIEGQYTWDDGSKFDYQNWNTGEPSGDKNSPEDCVELLHDEPGDRFGGWNDVPCNTDKHYICKKHAQTKVNKKSNTQTQNQSYDFVPTTFIFIISILIIALIAQIGITIYYRRLWLKEKPHKETQVLYKSDSRQRIIQ